MLLCSVHVTVGAATAGFSPPCFSGGFFLVQSPPKMCVVAEIIALVIQHVELVSSLSLYLGFWVVSFEMFVVICSFSCIVMGAADLVASSTPLSFV